MYRAMYVCVFHMCIGQSVFVTVVSKQWKTNPPSDFKTSKLKCPGHLGTFTTKNSVGLVVVVVICDFLSGITFGVSKIHRHGSLVLSTLNCLFQTLVPKIEEKSPHMSVFYEERDAMPNESDIGQIATAIFNSKKIILVLTSGYVRDSRREYEVRDCVLIIG